jgi:signal transduction histidine kinase
MTGMVKKIFLLFLFLLATLSHAQNYRAKIESLKKNLAGATGDEEKATLYSDLGWYYSNVSIDSAIYYSKKAISLSNKFNNPKTTAQIYSDAGAVYFTKGDIRESKINYTQSLRLRQKIKDSVGIASSTSNLGVVYERLGQRDSAMANYIKALAYFDKVQDINKIDFLKNNIALLYEKIQNFPKAEKMYKEVAAHRKATGQTTQLAMVYVNLGNLYKITKKYTDSEWYYKEAARIAQKDNNPMIASTAYFDLGFLYNLLDKPREAIEMFEMSLAFAKGVKSEYDLAKINNGLGQAYHKLKQDEKAKGFYLKALNAMDTMDRRETSRLHLDLISVYSSLNEADSSQYYLDRYKQNEGLLLKESVVGESIEMETKYQAERKEKLLLLKEAEVRQQQTLLMIVAIVAFFIIIVAYLLYRQQRLKNTQQQQEFELKDAISRIETQNRLQEQRLEISKDLHDNIGSQLTFIISSVDTINHAYTIDNPAISNKLISISNFTRSTIQELRDTIWAMNNKEITIESLRTRILNFIEKAGEAKEDMTFTFTVADGLDEISLSSIEGMNVYRTIQEGINNAIKHSGATTIAISITHEYGHVVITVTDNGSGFTKGMVAGNGLANMKKRIEDVGGVFKIHTSAAGTVLEIKLEKLMSI